MRKEIAGLEAITNRTPEQEQKLQELKAKLTELEQGSNKGEDPKKPTNYLPWIGGGIVLVLAIGVIVYLLTRNKNKEN